MRPGSSSIPYLGERPAHARQGRQVAVAEEVPAAELQLQHLAELCRRPTGYVALLGARRCGDCDDRQCRVGRRARELMLRKVRATH